MSPSELYRFTMGSRVWTYTSADRSIEYGGERYDPIPLGRGGMESKNELSKANLEVSLDVKDPLAALLLRSANEEILSLTLFAHSDAGTGTAWKGRLSSIRPTGSQLRLEFESIFTSLRRPGLRARYQRTCRHALYGRGCGLAVEDWAVDAVVSAVSGAEITVFAAGSQPDGWWTGGMVRGPDGTLRWILDHVGDKLKMSRPLESIAATGSTAVKLYPGCDHGRETCREKFNNLNNFGGFPWIPDKNPMGGSSIV